MDNQKLCGIQASYSSDTLHVLAQFTGVSDMFGVVRKVSLRSKMRVGSFPCNVYRSMSIHADDHNKVDDSKSSKLKIKSASVAPKIDSSTTIVEQSPEEYASAAEKKAMYWTKVGAVANMGLAISKGTVGYAISSTGLIADAANSLGDLLSDAVVYYSVTEARKRATPDRPWGRGKIEPLGTSNLYSNLHSNLYSMLFYTALLIYLCVLLFFALANCRCIICGWIVAVDRIRNWLHCFAGGDRGGRHLEHGLSAHRGARAVWGLRADHGGGCD